MSVLYFQWKNINDMWALFNIFINLKRSGRSNFRWKKKLNKTVQDSE